LTLEHRHTVPECKRAESLNRRKISNYNLCWFKITDYTCLRLHVFVTVQYFVSYGTQINTEQFTSNSFATDYITKLQLLHKMAAILTHLMVCTWLTQSVISDGQYIEN